MVNRSYSSGNFTLHYAVTFDVVICALDRGSVRSTRGLGPTMTARGQIVGISIGMLPQTLLMSITVQKTSKYYTTEFDLEGFLNGACISISNLPENIA